MAGLIVPLPGLTLTVAMEELSTRHLVSGTARVAGVLMTFLQLAFGRAIGSRPHGALRRLAPAGSMPPCVILR